MRISSTTTGDSPSNDSRDESLAEPTTRCRRFGELLKVWGSAIEVWLKILGLLVVGLATLLRSLPLH
ncbi:hypothetical protein V5735_18575 (plasmid) [Haladaptatus sp. SPP-AMP-3]|uniref:hypothetical protein n=1 Tax=Haladaptatus sp. SPP-AMP-3 TaxID=3121295 RepID=UPI003C2B4563